MKGDFAALKVKWLNGAGQPVLSLDCWWSGTGLGEKSPGSVPKRTKILPCMWPQESHKLSRPVSSSVK